MADYINPAIMPAAFISGLGDALKSELPDVRTCPRMTKIGDEYHYTIRTDKGVNFERVVTEHDFKISSVADLNVLIDMIILEIKETLYAYNDIATLHRLYKRK